MFYERIEKMEIIENFWIIHKCTTSQGNSFSTFEFHNQNFFPCKQLEIISRNNLLRTVSEDVCQIASKAFQYQFQNSIKDDRRKKTFFRIGMTLLPLRYR